MLYKANAYKNTYGKKGACTLILHATAIVTMVALNTFL